MLQTSLLLSLFLAIFQTPASPSLQSTPTAKNRAEAGSVATPENTKAKERREALAHVHSYADRAKAFSDDRNKARALARIASVVCSYDRAYARELFVSAYQATLSADAIPAPAQPGKVLLPPGVRASSVRPGPATEKAQISGTLGFVLARAGQCDPALGNQLRESDALLRKADADSPDYAYIPLSAAIDTVESDPQQAARFGETAAKGNLSDVGMQHFALFLLQLNEKDELAANRVFLSALDQIASRLEVDANDLAGLGLYVFTAPGARADGIVQVVIGGKVPILNLSIEREGISADITKAYLSTAVAVLTRQNIPVASRADYYVLATMLLPRVRQYVPEKIALLDAAMKLIANDVPPELKSPDAFTPLTKTPGEWANDDDGDIDKIADDDSRDERYLLRAPLVINTLPPERARALVEKIHSPQLRRQLAIQADFAEARKLLEAKKLDEAQVVAGRMPAGLERALLRLALSAAHSKSEKHAAAELATLALEDVSSVDEKWRPALVLAAGGVMARSDSHASVDVLHQGVEEINAYEARRRAAISELAGETDPVKKGAYPPELSAGREPFVTTVKFNYTERRFNLRVGDIWAWDVEDVVPRVAAFDLPAVEGAMLAVQSEEILSQALAALAASVLKASPAP